MKAQIANNFPIVINADDFGLSPATNRGIVESFAQRWVSSTTIVANGPAFDEACALAHEHGFTQSVGLHLNLVEGKPLTDPIKRESRFCSSSGVLTFSSRDARPLSRGQRAAVAQELSAQWDACIARGIEPSHLDSHRHSHLTWGVLSVVLRAAREMNIQAIRIASNVVPRANVKKAAYFGLINFRIHHSGLAATRYLAHSHQADEAVRRGRGPLEIIVHPSIGPDDTIIDRTDGPLMADRLRTIAISGDSLNFRALR